MKRFRLDVYILYIKHIALLCEGGNATHLTYNWWVAAWDYQANDLKPFYDIDEHENDTIASDKIVTALCPPKYCCQSVFGCDYLSEYLKRPTPYTSCWGDGGWWDSNNNTWIPDKEEYRYVEYPNGSSRSYWVELSPDEIVWEPEECNTYWEINWDSEWDSDQFIEDNGLLCAYGRDVNVPLCGACLEGWAELLGTTQCGECGTGWPMIVFGSFLLTWGITYYVLFYDSKPVDYSNTLGTKKLMRQDDIAGFQTILFKPVLYYFQSLNPILDTRGIYYLCLSFCKDIGLRCIIYTNF